MEKHGRGGVDTGVKLFYFSQSRKERNENKEKNLAYLASWRETFNLSQSLKKRREMKNNLGGLGVLA